MGIGRDQLCIIYIGTDIQPDVIYVLDIETGQLLEIASKVGTEYGKGEWLTYTSRFYADRYK